MNYREYLHQHCESCNLTDKEDVTSLIQFLLKEATDYHDIAMVMEKELKNRMTANEFESWSNEMAKEKFKNDINAMPDSDFKKCTLEHMDEIIGE